MISYEDRLLRNIISKSSKNIMLLLHFFCSIGVHKVYRSYKVLAKNIPQNLPCSGKFSR